MEAFLWPAQRMSCKEGYYVQMRAARMHHAHAPALQQSITLDSIFQRPCEFDIETAGTDDDYLQEANPQF